MISLRRSCYLLVLLTWRYGVAMNSSSETKLHDDLLNGYRKSVKPSPTKGTAVEVNLTFYLTSMKGFDTLSSKFSIAGLFVLRWFDDRMTWASSSYGNITRTALRQDDVWVPQMMLASDYDVYNIIGMKDLYVIYNSQGGALWKSPNAINAFCVADVTYFPMDVHECELRYLPMGYGESELTITLSKNGMDTSKADNNPQWEFINARSEIVVESATNTIGWIAQFKIKRRATYFIINMYLPLMALCITNVLVFALPADSGERVGFSVTVVLAVAVYLTILSDYVPSSSSPNIALICYVLVFHFLKGVLIVLCVVVGLRFHLRNDNKEIPKWIIGFTTCMNRTHYRQNRISSMTEISQVDNSTDKTQEKPASPCKQSNVVTVSWKDVGLAFDKLCGVVFVVMSMVFDVIFVIVIY